LNSLRRSGLSDADLTDWKKRQVVAKRVWDENPLCVSLGSLDDYAKREFAFGSGTVALRIKAKKAQMEAISEGSTIPASHRRPRRDAAPASCDEIADNYGYFKWESLTDCNEGRLLPADATTEFVHSLAPHCGPAFSRFEEERKRKMEHFLALWNGHDCSKKMKPPTISGYALAKYQGAGTWGLQDGDRMKKANPSQQVSASDGGPLPRADGWAEDQGALRQEEAAGGDVGQTQHRGSSFVSGSLESVLHSMEDKLANAMQGSAGATDAEVGAVAAGGGAATGAAYGTR